MRNNVQGFTKISVMVLTNYRVDTIFILKLQRGIILLKFKCSYDSCSLQIFRSCFIFVPNFIKIPYTVSDMISIKKNIKGIIPQD